MIDIKREVLTKNNIYIYVLIMYLKIVTVFRTVNVIFIIIFISNLFDNN